MILCTVCLRGTHTERIGLKEWSKTRERNRWKPNGLKSLYLCWSFLTVFLFLSNFVGKGEKNETRQEKEIDGNLHFVRGQTSWSDPFLTTFSAILCCSACILELIVVLKSLWILYQYDIWLVTKLKAVTRDRSQIFWVRDDSLDQYTK